MKYIVANVIIRGEALPLAKLNFVTRITPKRRDVVFGGETLQSALRLTETEKDDLLVLLAGRALGTNDIVVHAMRDE